MALVNLKRGMQWKLQISWENVNLTRINALFYPEIVMLKMTSGA